MGLRQTLNENPIVTTALTIVIMLSALVFIIMRLKGPSIRPQQVPTKCYFSDDDGKTWFIDEAKNVPPFDHGGKTAYRAMLFRCADGKPFVQRLESFDPDTKSKIEADIAAGKPALSAEYMYAAHGMMIKRPGEKNWTQLKDGDATSVTAWGEIMSPRCPDGSFNLRPVSVDENATP